MVLNICPVCGGDCIKYQLTSQPPINRTQCTKCGWVHEDCETIRYAPFVDDSCTAWIPPACRNCSNHPSNGGSGVCHCIMGQQTFLR